jgi:hypothetical protein
MYSRIPERHKRHLVKTTNPGNDALYSLPHDEQKGVASWPTAEAIRLHNEYGYV